MTHEEERIQLIDMLKKMSPAYSKIPLPQDEKGQKDLLRILMNVWIPINPPTKAYLEVQDSYLKREAILKGIVDEKTLKPCSRDERLYIWQGDITRIKADAIVNAANSAMLGCFEPLHGCIDNFIHSAAGLELRWNCKELMDRQGHDEPTGMAKITSGCNLPAANVIHTVGPIVPYGELRDEHIELLRSCYISCLKIAEENNLKSIVFCCISTGVFMFPAEEAARIAVDTVTEYLDEQECRYANTNEHADNGGAAEFNADRESNGYRGIEKVIFDVFSDRDKAIYEGLLM